MRKVMIQNMRKIKKAVPAIENRVKVRIGFGRDGINIKGSELNEYLVEKIVQAIDFGFCVDRLQLLLT